MRQGEFRKALEKFGLEDIRSSLRQLRTEIPMTQQQLASATGIPRSVIAQWERGFLEMPLKRVEKIWNTLLREQYARSESSLRGKSLRELRDQSGLTQREIAERLGIRQETLSRIESDGTPNHLLFSRVAEFLMDAIREKKEFLRNRDRINQLLGVSKQEALGDVPAETTVPPQVQEKQIEALGALVKSQEQLIAAYKEGIDELTRRIRSLEAEVSSLKAEKEGEGKEAKKGVADV